MTNIAKLVVDLTQRTSDSPGRPLPGDSPAVGMISARLLQIGVVGRVERVYAVLEVELAEGVPGL